MQTELINGTNDKKVIHVTEEAHTDTQIHTRTHTHKTSCTMMHGPVLQV